MTCSLKQNLIHQRLLQNVRYEVMQQNDAFHRMQKENEVVSQRQRRDVSVNAF